MIWALIRLFRRRRPVALPPCCTGASEHTDTLEVVGGTVLRWRCLDCGRIAFVGWVFTGVSNRKPHTWEHPDA